MNADLKNAHLEVQAYFLEARINGNVVEFTAPELTTDYLINIYHVNRRNPNLCPYVFRSDKEVKVVFFLKNEDGSYLTSNDGDEHMSLTPGKYANSQDPMNIINLLNISMDDVDCLKQLVDFFREKLSPNERRFNDMSSFEQRSFSVLDRIVKTIT